MAGLGRRLVLAVAVAGVASGLGAALGAEESSAQTTTVATALVTTTTAATTTTTTVPHSKAPPTLAAALSPCKASQAGGPCTVDPTEIVVSGSTPAAIEVSWVPEKGRPSGAPAPAQPSVVITKSTVCGKNVSCWGWPSELAAAGTPKPWILNGSYLVTACTLATGSCPPATTSSPAVLGVAVPASPPASLTATPSAASGVAVTWKPVAAAPPDLVGYEVSREGESVYACRTGASGPLPAPACPTTFTFHDTPNAGQWIYAVSSLRYGANATIAAVVPSAPLTSTVEVVAAGNVITPSNDVPFGLPSVPYYGPSGSIVAVPPSATIPPTTTPVASTTTPTEPGGPQSLPYDSGALTGSEASAAETGPKNPNLDAWAALAVGLLALALATHVWFVRRELRVFTAQRRRAGRRPGSGPR